MAQFAGLADVLHRHRLTANGVVRHRKHHERHIALVLAEHLFQLFQRHIALERQFQLRVLRLVDGDVDGAGLAIFDMTLRGVEVCIARHHIAFLHQVGEQHVLSCTALVGGDDVLESEDALHHLLELIERCGTGIALVAKHHRRPLAVAHGTGARIGQAVYVDLLGLQHEYVVVGFAEPLFSLLACALTQWFDHFDLPRFSKW